MQSDLTALMEKRLTESEIRKAGALYTILLDGEDTSKFLDMLDNLIFNATAIKKIVGDLNVKS